MSAWGPGPFENDDAADWVWELEDEPDAAVIIEALSVVVDTPIDESVDAADASNAVAAAVVLASARDGRVEGLPSEAVAWIAANRRSVDDALVALAAGAVQRIAVDSELKDLWDREADETWSTGLDELLDRLRGR